MSLGTTERIVRGLVAPAFADDALSVAPASIDWDAVVARLDAHRLAPLAHEALTRNQGLGAFVPQPVARRLEEAKRESMVVWLHEQQAIASLGKVFADAGLDPVLLKGPALKAFAYPSPAQRPLRDLDYLFRTTDDAIAADRLLRAAGYTPLKQERGDTRAILERLHQLPPLVAPDGQHAVEIHQRLFHGDAPDPSMSEAYWERVRHREILGRSVAFPSHEDQLVHLVHHAAVDHRFDNGPLTISDIAYLEASAPIDEERLALLARAHGLEQAVALVRGLARQAFPTFVDERPAIDEQAALSAWALMLAAPSEVMRVRARRQFAEATGLAPGRLLGRLFPGRAELDAQFGVAGGGLERFGQRLRHIARLVSRRLPALAVRRGALDEHYDRLDAWLDPRA